jgi:hypothetical protein
MLLGMVDLADQPFELFFCTFLIFDIVDGNLEGVKCDIVHILLQVSAYAEGRQTALSSISLR